jgi:hypothetical protein
LKIRTSFLTIFVCIANPAIVIRPVKAAIGSLNNDLPATSGAKLISAYVIVESAFVQVAPKGENSRHDQQWMFSQSLYAWPYETLKTLLPRPCAFG